MHYSSSIPVLSFSYLIYAKSCETTKISGDIETDKFVWFFNYKSSNISARNRKSNFDNLTHGYSAV